ncbi:cobyric acid synthase [Acuticoccus sp. I52.16.1]|uniref:cobyric acid synthase n=1 Tax=Acuticoccus sp. I52.16.1 TaxID=2928472 RepID=UPI001FD29C4A|nr:cobyric acid synthase [Acuticoccus sp. I52.16.1]UOM34480.1 cobyric acid synthase [Acuticoccus sp. I52.16.1]
MKQSGLRKPATAAIMVQGTGSDVGKSLLVAGLCRHFHHRGLVAKPFKSQNMSNNAAATPDGGEIGRAQMLQARAARIAPTVHLNPVLLKPQSETGAQVVVQGRLWQSASAGAYADLKPSLMPAVRDSFARVCDGADIVIVEGAGSPAEINLRADDIANMGFARAERVPVVLAADIARGGVIANLVGTAAVLDPADRAMVAGYIVNKFRGDVRLFDGGLTAITERTGWRSFGVVPWFAAAEALPAEDTLGLPTNAVRPGLRVVMPRTPHISNFDDCDPLRLEPGVAFTLAPLSAPMPEADLVVLPGSKSTIADAKALRAAGWHIDLAAHARRGGMIIGLCGGYQLLGRVIRDPAGHEGPPEETPGLGLLDVETEIAAPKVTRQSEGTCALAGLEGIPVAGYQIHMGRTTGPDRARPLVHVEEGADGAVTPSGRVMGCYLHGLFASDAFRAAVLGRFGVAASLAYDADVDHTLDALAEHVAAALDVDGLLALARGRT